MTDRGMELMRAGKIAYRSAGHRHAVIVDNGGCWTILLTGPKIRRWGFWVNHKFVKANKYFLTTEKHQCQ